MIGRSIASIGGSSLPYGISFGQNFSWCVVMGKAISIISAGGARKSLRSPRRGWSSGGSNGTVVETKEKRASKGDKATKVVHSKWKDQNVVGNEGGGMRDSEFGLCAHLVNPVGITEERRWEPGRRRNGT